jgi:hypothetical protein
VPYDFLTPFSFLSFIYILVYQPPLPPFGLGMMNAQRSEIIFKFKGFRHPDEHIPLTRNQPSKIKFKVCRNLSAVRFAKSIAKVL